MALIPRGRFISWKKIPMVNPRRSHCSSPKRRRQFRPKNKMAKLPLIAKDSFLRGAIAIPCLPTYPSPPLSHADLYLEMPVARATGAKTGIFKPAPRYTDEVGAVGSLGLSNLPSHRHSRPCSRSTWRESSPVEIVYCPRDAS